MSKNVFIAKILKDLTTQITLHACKIKKKNIITAIFNQSEREKRKNKKSRCKFKCILLLIF